MPTAPTCSGGASAGSSTRAVGERRSDRGRPRRSRRRIRAAVEAVVGAGRHQVWGCSHRVMSHISLSRMYVLHLHDRSRPSLPVLAYRPAAPPQSSSGWLHQLQHRSVPSSRPPTAVGPPQSPAIAAAAAKLGVVTNTTPSPASSVSSSSSWRLPGGSGRLQALPSLSYYTNVLIPSLTLHQFP